MQIFQKVEEESARRAHEQQLEEARSSRPTTASCSPPRPTASPLPPAAPVAVSVARDPARERRRGSISVSRFGQVCRRPRPPSPFRSRVSLHPGVWGGAGVVEELDTWVLLRVG